MIIIVFILLFWIHWDVHDLSLNIHDLSLGCDWPDRDRFVIIYNNVMHLPNNI